MKWIPIKGGNVKLQWLPGWLFQLTHNGQRTLGVWTNGSAVWTVLAGDA